MGDSSGEVWFAIPSANPELCRETLPRWRERGYRVAVLQNQVRAEIPADVVVWSDRYPGWSESINILTREIVPRSAPVVVSGGDDMLPDPHHTAQELAAEFLGRFPDGFGVMQPHGDGYRNARDYCGSPFLGRRWIDTMYGGRGPMWGQYQHNWGDVELYWVARAMHALWERPDLEHRHEHFTRRGEEAPEWWVRNVDRFDRLDVNLFIARSWQRFPGCEPLGVDREFDASELINDKMFPEQHAMWVYGKLIERALGARQQPQAMLGALRECRRRGLDPVAVYGAGHHTKNCRGVLADPEVRVACVIDDRAGEGDELFGYPVVRRERALEMGVGGVVISSDSMEGAIWRRCDVFREAGVAVIPLYATEDELEAEASVMVEV